LAGRILNAYNDDEYGRGGFSQKSAKIRVSDVFRDEIRGFFHILQRKERFSMLRKILIAAVQILLEFLKLLIPQIVTAM